jgi:hypothetical protein
MKLRYGLFFAVLAVASAASLCGQTVAPNSQLTVKLLAPLSTKTNKAGDKISAQVIDPSVFKGDIVGGEVKKVKNGGKINGKSVLNFTFDTLYHKGVNIPIESSVLSVTNSRGQENVDEEGEVVKKKNNVGKVALGTALGAGLGAILGGGKGAAIGAGAGLAGSLILVEATVKGPSIDFAPGSEFVLSVKERMSSAHSH